ncbi:DUF1987 domain-containing protein [bacterium]|nr:DUF1987 domain-containing protein [bacterium]
MKNYIVEATKYTPYIEFDIAKGNLKMEGDTYPENSYDTFKPLLDKIDEYFLDSIKSLNVEINIEFLNTSSSKMMREIISKLDEYFEADHNISLKWYYPDGDIDLQESWEMLLEDVLFPYEIVAVED